MPALNPQYVIAPSIQQYFVDKDTGLPLSSGYVVFLEDTSRTTQKQVYSISGMPGSYVYNVIPTVSVPNQVGLFGVQLTDIGTFDEVIYYYPYDMSGNVDLYFIEVYDMNGVFQFSVEAWPNIFAQGNNGTNVPYNYSPNGQFWFHTNIPATNTTLAGQITQDSTPVAQGGWSMEMSPGFTSTTFVSFHRYAAYPSDSPSNPIGRPRYAIEIQTTNSDSHPQDLTLTFADVNKFNGETYTFAFSGISNSGSNLNTAELYVVYNFGSGGSGNDTQFIGNLTFMNGTFTIIPSTILFQDISSFTIGTFNDDNVQIRIRFPAGNTYHVQITDVILTQGSVVSPIFPDTPVSEMCYESIAGFLPEPFPYTGSNYYLPLVVTPFGLDYDTQVVGSICSSMSLLATNPAYVPCDGATFQTSGYTNYIPNARLQNALFDISSGFPLFGTGSEFATADLLTVSPADAIRFWTNTLGTPAAPADSVPAATGFAFSSITAGQASTLFVTSYYINSVVYVHNINPGVVAAITSNISGFTVTNIRGNNSSEVGNDAALASFTGGLGAITAAQYIQFHSYNGGTNPFYLWFHVDGAGADPTQSGTPVRVNTLSTYSASDVAKIIVETLNGFEISSIVTVAGSSLPNSSYWTFTATTGQQYVVWYSLNGTGVQPIVSGAIYIPVIYQTSDTAAIVASETQLALNTSYFAVPDLRGVFLRGFDNSAGIDPDSALRYALNGVTYGDQIGTYQIDEIIDHYHTVPVTQASVTATSTTPGGGLASNAANATTQVGGNESRPINVYTNYLIHL